MTLWAVPGHGFKAEGFGLNNSGSQPLFLEGGALPFASIFPRQPFLAGHSLAEYPAGSSAFVC